MDARWSWLGTGLLIASTLAAGCDDDGSGARDGGEPPGDARQDTGDPDGPALEVGTGGTVYERVEDGGAVELVHGPQGGWHILLAARFRGMDPEGVLLSYQVLRADGTTPLNERFSVRLRRSTVSPSGAWWNRTGDLGVLAVMGAEEAADMDAEVHAEVVASDGTTVSDVLRVHIVDEIR
ncbi:MAG: hypothetical protein IT379_33780 [Deltaproteobacteria bacterium]|nr:hypothetical protein [Deltaproteobacteria bacterium]